MVAKFKDLDQAEIDDIKREYLIYEKDKEHLNFVLGFRERLYDAILKLWESKEKGSNVSTDKCVQDIVVLGKDIASYMRECPPKDFYKRLVFVEKIGEEFNRVQFSILWGLHKYGPEIYEATRQEVEDVKKFIRYTALKTIFYEVDLDKMEQESSKEAYRLAKKKLAANLINVLSEKQLAQNDVLYLIAYACKAKEDREKQVAEIEKNKCADCNIDDCMLGHCVDHAKIVALQKEKEKYKNIVDVLTNSDKDFSITGEKLEDLILGIDSNFAKLLVKYFCAEGEFTGVSSRFGMNSLLPGFIYATEEGLKQVVEQSVKDGDGVRDITLDLVLNTIMCGYCNIEKTGKEQLCEELKLWYDEMEKSRLDSSNAYKLRFFNKLNNQMNLERKPEEHGGE